MRAFFAYFRGRRLFSLLGVIVLAATPWLFNLRGFFADVGGVIEYAASVFLCAGWLGTAFVNHLLQTRAHDRARLDFVCGIVVVAIVAISLPLIFFGEEAYASARFRLQRAAAERFIAGSDACPGIRCEKGGGQLTGIVWGSNEFGWMGICHDPQGVLVAAKRLMEADKKAGLPRQPRAFGSVVYRARPLTGGWIDCGLSKGRLGK